MEAQDHIDFIKAEKWPDVLLPVIHRERRRARQEPNAGVIRPGELSTIYLVNLFSLPAGLISDILRDKPTEKFETVEALVEAGWTVD